MQFGIGQVRPWNLRFAAACGEKAGTRGDDRHGAQQHAAIDGSRHVSLLGAVPLCVSMDGLSQKGAAEPSPELITVGEHPAGLACRAGPLGMPFVVMRVNEESWSGVGYQQAARIGAARAARHK
jgi:hypothetical protein